MQALIGHKTQMKVKLLKEAGRKYRIRINAGSFTEGDPVDTPDGFGIVVEVREEDFDGPGGEVDASSENPAYVVGLEDESRGVAVYSGDELSASEMPETDVENPAEDVAEEEMSSNSPTANRFSYPDSWEESETPNRIILLDMWSSMQGQFDCGGACCKGTMLQSGMSNRAANEFCASAKDRVLGGWQGWRSGG